MKQKLLVGIACLIIGFVAGLTWGQYRLEKIQKEYTEAALQAEQAARAKEQAWQAAHDTLAGKYKEDTKNAEAEITALRKRIRAGAHRLSVPARSCTVSGNPGAATGETRAELDAQTADDLVAIAADGDRAIRELNLCIDQYNALK